MTVDVTRVAFAQTEYRLASVEDASVKTKHPLALELTMDTFLKNESDALLFGSNVLSLRKLDRWTWGCYVVKRFYPNLAIGRTITLAYPRFGFTNGKNFIIKRLKTDELSPYSELTLFGPEA